MANIERVMDVLLDRLAKAERGTVMAEQSARQAARRAEEDAAAAMQPIIAEVERLQRLCIEAWNAGEPGGFHRELLKEFAPPRPNAMRGA